MKEGTATTKPVIAAAGNAGLDLFRCCPHHLDPCQCSDGCETIFAFARAAHLAQHAIAVLVTMMLALPCLLQAQKPVGSLADLKARVRIGETLLVTDDLGRELKGELLDLSVEALTLRLRGGASTIAERNTRLVRRPDTLWRGLLIGAAVGAGLAIWDYAVDPSEPGNAVISVVAIAGGAAIGAGIDAMIGGPKTLFVARLEGRPRAMLSVKPILSASRHGVALSLRF